MSKPLEFAFAAVMLWGANAEASPVFRSLSQHNVATSKGFALREVAEHSTVIERYDLETWNSTYSFGRDPDVAESNGNHASQAFTLFPGGFSWIGDARAESVIVPGQIEQSGGGVAGFDIELELDQATGFVVLWTAQAVPLPDPSMQLYADLSLQIFDKATLDVIRFGRPTASTFELRTDFIELAAGRYQIIGDVRAYVWPDPQVATWYSDRAHLEVFLVSIPEPSTLALAIIAGIGLCGSSKTLFSSKRPECGSAARQTA